MTTRRLVIVWGKWGPYHFARFNALREAGPSAGWEVWGAQYSADSQLYAWKAGAGEANWVNLAAADHESGYQPCRLARRAAHLFTLARPDVLFAPSYWPWSLHLNAQARLRGAPSFMHPGRLRPMGNY